MKNKKTDMLESIARLAFERGKNRKEGHSEPDPVDRGLLYLDTGYKRWLTAKTAR